MNGRERRPEEVMNIIRGIKIWKRQRKDSCISFKFLPTVVLHSACEENTERELMASSTCISDDLNEFRHQLFIVALIKGIDDDDHGLRENGEDGGSRCQNRFNHQSLELIDRRLMSNSWLALKDPPYEWFRSRDGKGKLICKCRDEAFKFASVTRSSKEETGGKSPIILATFSDSLRHR